MSLIELVIAVFLMASVVVSLSMAFPKASQNAARTQQRSVATNLAQAQLQIMKSRTYAFTDLTDAGVLDNNCDCSAVGDVSVLPSTGTSVAGTNFSVAPCVHFVLPPAWTSQCSADGDTGYKHVVVYVSWSSGAQTYVISEESMITRF